MKRSVKFQEGGTVERPMTAAEIRRRNIERINQRRATNRQQSAARAEMERFNERMRTGTLTPDDMRRMGGTPTPQVSSGGGRGGGGGEGGGRAMVPSGGERMPMPRPSSGELMRQGAGMGGGAPRGGPRVVGGAPGMAGAGVAIGLAGEALRRYMENRRNQPITGNFERGMEPEGSNEAADAYAAEEAAREEARRVEAEAARQRAAPRPAPRPRPQQRRAAPSEADALNQRELDRIAAIRGIMESGDVQPQERNFFERMGIRRTNETGEGRPSTGSLSGDLRELGRALGFKKGGQIKSKTMMKKGGKVMKYREGGPIRQGMQSPKAQEGRAEMAEDVMRRERAREPISDKARKAARMEANMDSGPLTDAEKERMRSSGFKKGGMIKPKAKTAMKKGGVVKKAAGGKVAAPKKMMKGGMTSKPKKMMGGGKVKYAKGGMTRGCK